ncbi:enoyl-CoA hydratase domain-containing protein 3, mitochondrial-like [Musca vetustissima]|uniref:enoyl-CoA hydratase domain-containing protein 3, mitochondrial-like n=1 Tax=Musca vetustissima TaxID=27455 RepID=UPI002AB7C120|nr:enoyl-CoA hydratase domain-containing protein 3, mitochondrial-like [Musca vetustissima]
MLRHLFLWNKPSMLSAISSNLCALNTRTATTTTTSSMSTNATRQFCQISETNGVREICLNEPKTRNALSLGMMDEILSGLKQTWEDTNLRCIIISSTGPVWSSGHDLKELVPERGEEQQRAVFEKLTEVIYNIRKAPVPVLAKVNGVVAAGGVQLVSSCDIIVCSEKSSFITPSANFGVFASTPAVAMTRVMSHSKCLDMLMTGHPISAKDAYIQGMVSRVVPTEELDAEIVKIVNAIKQKSRSVLALGKEFFYQQLELTMEEAYQQGAKKMTENLKLNDSKEGLRSFMEKRKPVWSHL